MPTELRRARGQLKEGSHVYEQAEAFVDAMISKASTVLEKTEPNPLREGHLYQAFHSGPDHFEDAANGYAIVEQVRARITVHQLLTGTVQVTEARSTGRTIARLRLQPMLVKLTAEVKRLEDEIFLVGHARWVSPGAWMGVDASVERIETTSMNARLVL
jgi:hypothetical protein